MQIHGGGNTENTWKNKTNKGMEKDPSSLLCNDAQPHSSVALWT